MSKPRVRFAPSPTGYLHIGGARTALYNWLWARKHGGSFILRIEDTDRQRNTPESMGAIVGSLRWLGLDWDEGPDVGGDFGPYTQGERLELYGEYAERLIAAGHAYRCYCTPEELDRARSAQASAGHRKAFRYPGTCRDRTDAPGLPSVIRFKAPTHGTTGWADLVRGRIDVPNDTLQDFILLRNTGLPLYNFACVVDDMRMGLTLVARGEEHIVNTPPQLLLYSAFGCAPPEFAHLPMILAPSGEKLSKRHAAVSVLEYRDMGYVPDAVLNYLARIGWSHGDQEIFSRSELIEKFDWASVGKTAGKYDAKKFAYVQAEHLRRMASKDIALAVTPFLEERGLVPPHDHRRLEQAIETVRTRATTLADVADMIDFFVREQPNVEDKARAKFLHPAVAGRLRALADVVRPIEPFQQEVLSECITGWLERENLALKDVAQPARVALTGRTKSPGLFEVMEVLGREATVERLERGAADAETPAT